ncbi:MAG TPA: Uma2 family endonuclease [Acidobacteriaceae bacterium]|nr:Uma2 family endonuclease [Acidobacteriaceae bacterium]
MTTTARVPVEVYLRSSEYEPDAEYVDGEIEERPMGTYDHADWQQAIQQWFAGHAQEWKIRVLPELRVQVSPTRFRVPDVTVLDRAQPREQIVTHAPLAVFEILSPEDTVKRLNRKLADYAAMGIPQIWVVDPESGAFQHYRDGALIPSSTFEIPNRLQFEVREIAALLQR